MDYEATDKAAIRRLCGIVRTIDGRKARFCGETCAESFREDRDCGVIYPAVATDDERIKWEDASMRYRWCAYCRTDLMATQAY